MPIILYFFLLLGLKFGRKESERHKHTHARASWCQTAAVESWSSLRTVNLTSLIGGHVTLPLSGSVQSNAALFSLSGGLRLHISVIRLLCSAVLQLCWHLGVAPLFLTVPLPMLLGRWSLARTEVHVSEWRCFFKTYSRQVEVKCDAMSRSPR